MFEDAPLEYRRALPRYIDALPLVHAGRDLYGREAWMHPKAASAWEAMSDAAKADGSRLILISAFRSIARQAEIVRRKRELGMPWQEILRVNAYPGFSEHHTGCAVDLGSPSSPPLAEAFDQMPEFAWLACNASRYGFRMSYPWDNELGMAYEPWHWMWHEVEPPDDGPDAARKTRPAGGWHSIS